MDDPPSLLCGCCCSPGAPVWTEPSGMCGEEGPIWTTLPLLCGSDTTWTVDAVCLNLCGPCVLVCVPPGRWARPAPLPCLGPGGSATMLGPTVCVKFVFISVFLMFVVLFCLLLPILFISLYILPPSPSLPSTPVGFTCTVFGTSLIPAR